jgi:hypothetical protein
MGRDTMTAWKQLELRVAKALGGTRTGPQGRHGSDVTGTPYAVEVKRTTRYSLRRAWIDQARRQARQEAKPWLLVIAEHGDRSPLVVMELATFIGVRVGRQPHGFPNDWVGE